MQSKKKKKEKEKKDAIKKMVKAGLVFLSWHL